MNKDKIDIAIFTPTLEGGVGRVISLLAGGFVKAGKRVEIVLLHAGETDVQIPQGINVVDLGKPRASQAVFALRKYLLQKKPAHLLSASFHANVVAILASRPSPLRRGSWRGSARTRVHISEHIALGEALRRIGRAKRLVLTLLIRFLYPFANSVIAVSRGAAADVRRIARVPARRVYAIANPVVTPELFRMAEDSVDHHWFTGAHRVILGVDRLAEQKDFSTLIRAFAHLLIARDRATSSLRLVILGDGEERAALLSLARELGVADRVDLLGHVQNPYAYMKRASLFALSSRFEGLPTVLIEALALGVPVVSTDCPSGPREILEGEKFGALVPVGDVDALAKAMEGAVGEHKKAIGFDLKRYTPEEAAKEYLEVMSK